MPLLNFHANVPERPDNHDLCEVQRKRPRQAILIFRAFTSQGPKCESRKLSGEKELI